MMHSIRKLYLPNVTAKNVLLLFIAILAFGLLLIQTSKSFPHDFLINLRGTQNLLHTGVLYSWTPTAQEPVYYSYISTPFVALVLSPLSSLDTNTATSLYRLINTTIYVIAIILICRTYHLQWTVNSTLIGWSVLIMLLWQPTQDSIGLGQINEAILLCLVVAYWGWMTDHEYVTGLGVGIAAALKITPILLVLLFLFSGRWRAAAMSVIVAALLGGISCTAVGVNQCVVFGTTVFPNISRGSADYYHVGLNGLVYRLLTANNMAYWTNLQPPPDTFIGRVLPVIELLAFIVLGYFSTRRIPRNAQGKSALFALWIAGILLSAPITWWHYTIWLLVGLPTLAEFALRAKRRPRLLIVTGILLINLSPYFLLALGTLSRSPIITYALLALPCVGLVILTAFFWTIQANLPSNREAKTVSP